MAIAPAGPVSAIGAARSGLSGARTQAAEAAHRIVAAGAPPADPLPTGLPAAPDLGPAMVDLIAARRAYAANADGLRTAAALQDERAARLA